MRIIMSKWTEIRDNIVDANDEKYVTEDVKQRVTAALLAEVLPTIENAVDGFTATTREQAKTETGWCKIRDGIVLPLVMEGAVFVVKTVLEKTVTQTAIPGSSRWMKSTTSKISSRKSATGTAP